LANNALLILHSRCRLGRCANIITGEDSPLPRVKPFKVGRSHPELRLLVGKRAGRSLG
jgi:hypothetical protein